MKNNYLTMILVSFVLVIFDISFFSFLEVYGGTLFLSLVAAILISLFGGYQRTLIYGISAIIFLTIFSSLPVLVMIVGFWMIPMIIAYLRKSQIPELPIIGAVPVILVSLILFEVSFMIAVGAVTASIVMTAIFFVAMNSIVGVFAYGVILNQSKRHKIGIK